MIQREAVGNDRKITMTKGDLRRCYPDVRIATSQGAAEFTISGGLGYVPMTFTGLASPSGHVLSVDGAPLHQAVHGNDFWQTDYDPESATWSLTYNVPFTPGKPHHVQFSSAP
jgi:hypothetical protein